MPTTYTGDGSALGIADAIEVVRPNDGEALNVASIGTTTLQRIANWLDKIRDSAGMKAVAETITALWTFSAGLTVSGVVATFNAGLTVATGTARFDGALDVNGAADFDGTARFDGAVTITNTQTVSDVETNSSRIDMTGTPPASNTSFNGCVGPGNLIRAWGYLSIAAGGAVTVVDGFNIAGAAADGTDQSRVTFAGDMADVTKYVMICQAIGNWGVVHATDPAAGTCDIAALDFAGSMFPIGTDNASTRIVFVLVVGHKL